MTNIMAGLAHTPVIPITFNRRLVAKQTRKTVTPCSCPAPTGRRKITFDAKRPRGRRRLHAARSLPRPRPDHHSAVNRYASKTLTTGIYCGSANSQAGSNHKTRRTAALALGWARARWRWYQAQARRLDRLAGEARR